VNGPLDVSFEEFVQQRWEALVRFAHLLGGDLGHAEDLVQTAPHRSARRWRAARDAPDLAGTHPREREGE
jgi:hypothetical protein